jgi:hypothetical protein
MEDIVKSALGRKEERHLEGFWEWQLSVDTAIQQGISQLNKKDL